MLQFLDSSGSLVENSSNNSQVMAQHKKESDRSAQDSKWRLTERIVAVIEKSLTPDAQVLHDQKLPVLTSSDGQQRERQFDVVIKSGTPPRQTLTVVEVQDRSRVVGEDQLVAWHHKMNQVGAQHLICVSKKGFSASAKGYAMRAGPTVRIVRLNELAAGHGPLQTALGSLEIVEFVTGPLQIEYTLIMDDLVREALSDGRAKARISIEFRLNEKLAALSQPGRKSLVSLDGLIEERRAALKTSQTFEEGVHNVKIVSEADGVFDYADGNTRQRLTFDITDTIQVKKYKVPLTCHSYEQEQLDGALAWIMRASFRLHEHDVDLRLTLVPDTAGSLVLEPKIFGLPPNASFSGTFKVHS